MPSRLRAFVRLARPKFLVGGAIAGALGTAIAAYAGRPISWTAYLAAQLAVSGFHLMTHFANDYFDIESDRRTTRTEFSGGSGVLVAGELAPSAAIRAALACALVGALATAWLATTGLGAAAAFAAASGLLAWGYSAPPLRLLGRGLGELDTALIVAVLFPWAAASAQGQPLDALLIASTLPAASAMFVLMIGVELPDIAADRATGKRNLVVRLGVDRAATLARLAIVGTFAGVVIATQAGAPRTLAILQTIAIVPAVDLSRAFDRAGTRSARPELAARSVALFVIVAFYTLLAYLVPVGIARTP